MQMKDLIEAHGMDNKLEPSSGAEATAGMPALLTLLPDATGGSAPAAVVWSVRLIFLQ